MIHTYRWLLAAFVLAFFCAGQAAAQMPTSVKNSVIRAENPRGAKELLILPYAFSSETMGLNFGVGAAAKGYGQDQLLVAATAFGSADELDGKDGTLGVIAGMWDLRIPYTRRFFLTAFGSAGYYPRKRAYSSPVIVPGVPRPGSNGSGADQYIQVGGNDNWVDFRLEYVLPIGAAKDQAMMTYKLEQGMLTSPPTGGKKWNPLESGVTNLMLKQYNRHQNYQIDPISLERSIHPVQLGIAYDNTDFSINPSFGSRQFLGVTRDFGWSDSDQTWTFLELEAAKFFSFGTSNWARQRVLALNLWTGDTPSWNETALPNGLIRVNNAPPYYEGATLGGFDRMRAFPSNRFNDRSVIYTSAEYRYTPDWNPLGEWRLLRFLKMDWWQFVGFVEGGRVARKYSLSELTKDWQFDAGASLRFMVAGGVVRIDAAYGNEGGTFWFMAGQPF